MASNLGTLSECIITVLHAVHARYTSHDLSSDYVSYYHMHVDVFSVFCYKA